MSDTTSKPGKVPNTQPNNHIPLLLVEIFLAGAALGAFKAPQAVNLSKNGNVTYFGMIRRGLRFPGEVAEVLKSLTFQVNGEATAISSRGVTLSAPKIGKNGLPVAGTGGEPMVTYCIQVDTLQGDDTDVQFVNITTKRLHNKAGKDVGYSLRVASMPRSEGFGAAEQVTGEVEGLLIEA